MSGVPELHVRCRARLGEGICWHPVRQRLAWIDILGGRIFEHSRNGVIKRDCGQMVGAIAPAVDGSYVAALRDGVYRLQVDTGTMRRVAAAPYDSTRFRFNDGKIDARGRFWVGTLALNGEQRTSSLYCCEPSGVVRAALGGVSISNGLAWSTGGETLYYIDTLTSAVQRFDFDLESGTITGGKVVISFGADEGLPDGCVLDRDGNLWVAHWGGGRVTQSNPRTGQRLRSCPLPVRNVTSCAFGGPHGDQLFISTAQCDGVEEELAGSVFMMEPGTTGAPCHLAPAES